MILDVITYLNKEKHGAKATFASLERELKIGNGSIKKWAKHSPSLENLLLIADHFDVSLDYLCERKKSVDRNISADELEIITLYRKADQHDKETVKQVLSRYQEDTDSAVG